VVDGSVPDHEFMALLVHECGHVIHGNLGGTQASGESAFHDGNQIFYADSPAAAFFSISWQNEHVMRRSAANNDFVSGYAKSDPFEDFAETFAAYVLHRDMLVTRAATNAAIAAKLAWMDTMFPGASAIAKTQFSWKGSIPWDITKLPYAWTAQLVASN
jgi:hypothetical protein